MMDDLLRFNRERWEALAAANVAYSRPMYDLTPDVARQRLDPYGVMGEVAGQRVLCLGSGGGQQSAAFALLGAAVTVLDLADTQLERDRLALKHYGLDAALFQGDMRDLSRFADAAFDLVYHPYSINFVPDTAPVFDGVRRVLRSGGLYRLDWHNPLAKGLDERDWNGTGYNVKLPYRDGEVVFDDPDWDIYEDDGTVQRVAGPREFNHTLSTVFNGLIGRGFTLLGLWEQMPEADAAAAPGSWPHFVTIMPPYFALWARRG